MMKCRLLDIHGKVVKEFELENDCVPTPQALVDGATERI